MERQRGCTGSNIQVCRSGGRMNAALLRRFWKSRYIYAPHPAFLKYFVSVFPKQQVDFHYLLAVSEQGMKFDSENHRAAWIAAVLWDSQQTGAPIFGGLAPDLQGLGNGLQSEL